MGSPRDAERALVLELAESVLEQTAPEEVLILEDTSRDYFESPDRALRAGRAEESLGFGVELTLLAPYVLAVVTAVVQYLLGIASEALKDEVKPSMAAWVRRLIRRTRDGTTTETAPAPAALSRDQLAKVREIAYDRARAVGVDERQAAVLADAVAGGLVLAG